MRRSLTLPITSRFNLGLLYEKRVVAIEKALLLDSRQLFGPPLPEGTEVHGYLQYNYKFPKKYEQIRRGDYMELCEDREWGICPLESIQDGVFTPDEIKTAARSAHSKSAADFIDF
jgi:hypothetical protein